MPGAQLRATVGALVGGEARGRLCDSHNPANGYPRKQQSAP
jgi:hypothetical protein